MSTTNKIFKKYSQARISRRNVMTSSAGALQKATTVSKLREQIKRETTNLKELRKDLRKQRHQQLREATSAFVPTLLASRKENEAFSTSGLGQQISSVSNKKIKKLLLAIHGLTTDKKISNEKAAEEVGTVIDPLVSQLIKTDSDTRDAALSILEILKEQAAQNKALQNHITEIAVTATVAGSKSHAELQNNIQKPSLMKPLERLRWWFSKRQVTSKTVNVMRVAIKADKKNDFKLVQNGSSSLGILKLQLMELLVSAKQVISGKNQSSQLPLATEEKAHSSNSSNISDDGVEESKADPS